MTVIDYKSAGVDIAAGNLAVQRIKKNVEKTFAKEVLTNIGSFGALFDLKPIMNQYEHPVLVQSIDGVGTKMIVARMMNFYDTIGIDLVSATTNDIIVLGAKPLTLLDYIANDKLQPDVIEKILQGMTQACLENQISLVGGEMAEMPGTYLPGEHDLVGVITGVVEKEKVILGKNIVPGDILLAFPSSGLHTNGYSLARKIIFDIAKLSVDHYVDELQMSVGEALLIPHLNYTHPVHALLDAGIKIKGMAHITGGGMLENLPRILPNDCAVEIKLSSWPHHALFSLLIQSGKLNQIEAYRTFNMGVGLVMVMSEEMAARATSISKNIYYVGQVVSGNKEVRLCKSA